MPDRKSDLARVIAWTVTGTTAGAALSPFVALDAAAVQPWVDMLIGPSGGVVAAAVAILWLCAALRRERGERMALQRRLLDMLPEQARAAERQAAESRAAASAQRGVGEVLRQMVQQLGGIREDVRKRHGN